MSPASAVQYGLFLLIVTLLVKPVSAYLARVFSGQSTWLDTPLFAGLVIVIVLVVSALSYLPVLALGPIVERLALP